MSSIRLMAKQMVVYPYDPYNGNLTNNKKKWHTEQHSRISKALCWKKLDMKEYIRHNSIHMKLKDKFLVTADQINRHEAQVNFLRWTVFCILTLRCLLGHTDLPWQNGSFTLVHFNVCKQVSRMDSWTGGCLGHCPHRTHKSDFFPAMCILALS